MRWLEVVMAFLVGASVALSLVLRSLRRLISRAELQIANTTDDIRAVIEREEQ